MAAVEVKGVIELRKALRKFEPNLAKELTSEMRKAVKPIVSTARGYVPSAAPLSGWNEKTTGNSRFPSFNSSVIKKGITFKTSGSKPNRRGFKSQVKIFNKTAAGSIYETAGRKNPNGRIQAPMMKHYTDAGTANARFEGRYIRSGTKDQSLSNNPNAGKQFIDSLGQIYTIKRAEGQRGRVSRKSNGRLIYRAYGENQGAAKIAILRAIALAENKFKASTGKVI